MTKDKEKIYKGMIECLWGFLDMDTRLLELARSVYNLDNADTKQTRAYERAVEERKAQLQITRGSGSITKQIRINMGTH